MMNKINALCALLLTGIFKPVHAHMGHGIEYSLGYVLLLVSLFLLLAKLYKNH